MKNHGILFYATHAGLAVLLAFCAGLSLFLWAFRQWLGGIAWIVCLFVLVVGSFPTQKNRIPPAMMWAAAGFACGGVLWWMIILNYVRG